MQDQFEQRIPSQDSSDAQAASGSTPEAASDARNHGDRRPPRRMNTRPDRMKQGPRTPSAMRPCPAELTNSTQKSERPPIRPNRRFTNQDHDPVKKTDNRNIRQPFDGVAHLYEVIQVRLVRTQRLVEVNTNGLRLGPNMPVLIRVHRNILLATTVGYRHRRVAEINSLPFVVRNATDEDKLIDAENALIERRAHELASNYAIEQNLQMKVLSADLSHDHKNITINFASDVRVDFRDMVAYLAGQLKLRVEMYQLGLRNGTGIICGLGSCGQLLCCGRFLGQFDPIAVKQLRAQGLATNPKRISGVCGRLYCCMSYEYCDYMKERRAMPKKGRRIFSRWGIGRVSDIDTLREEIVVTYENGEVQRLTPNDFLPATDETVAKVEAGEYEFPLEPAKFYLNHDPSSAAETETQTKSNKPQPQHTPSRHIEAAPKKGTAPRRPLRSTSVAPANAETPAANAEKQPHTRRRRPLAKHHPAEPVAAHEVPRPRHENSPATPPVSAPATAAPAPAKPIESTHAPRMTRKVRAHQANLEDAMNANTEARNTPSKTSRRRYSPMNNQDN